MRDLVERGKILEIKSGSNLYGLNTENSDEDYVGIFLAPKEYILGLQTIEQVDLSIKIKHENGKNTKDAVDRNFYEFKRFCKLAMQGNPNIIEILFTNEDNIVYCNKYGKKILDNKHLFVSRDIIPKFEGFAQSQKKKLLVRTENMVGLIEGLAYLQKVSLDGREKDTLPELIGNVEFDKYFKQNNNKVHFNIGAHTINRNITVKSGIKWLENTIANSSNRIENIKNAGWEFKHGSHLLRLLYQIEELCETGILKYPLKQNDTILKVKKGQVSYSDFAKLVEEVEAKVEIAKKLDILQKHPRTKEIEKIVMEVYEEWLLGNTK